MLLRANADLCGYTRTHTAITPSSQITKEYYLKLSGKASHFVTALYLYWLHYSFRPSGQNGERGLQQEADKKEQEKIRKDRR
jgi:hypothetical protein